MAHTDRSNAQKRGDLARSLFVFAESVSDNVSETQSLEGHQVDTSKSVSQLVDQDAVRAAIAKMRESFKLADKSTDLGRAAASANLSALAMLDTEHKRLVKAGRAAKTAWSDIHTVATKLAKDDRTRKAFAESTLSQYAAACTYALAQGLDDLAVIPTPSQAKVAQGSAEKIIAAGKLIDAKTTTLSEALKVMTAADEKGKTLTIGQVAAAVKEPSTPPAPRTPQAPTSSIPKDAATLIAEVVAMSTRLADIIGAIKVLTPDADGRKLLASRGKVLRQHAATIVTTFDDKAREEAKATVAAAKPSVGRADAA